jgi:hypothetical protein
VAYSGYGQVSFPRKAVYIPKDFVPHAASLRQGCPHCGRFVTAAPRRSPGSVSVPMWPADLSVRLPVAALVGRYPANKLIGFGPLSHRLTFGPQAMPPGDVMEYYPRFPAAMLLCEAGYPNITHPSATDLAVRSTCMS